MSIRFRIWRDVVEELGVAAAHRPDVPRVAFLLGRAPEEGTGPTCTGYLDLEPVDGVLPWLLSVQRDWPRFERRLERMAPDRLLGWLWMRPQGGARLTPEAQLVHRSLFSLPWQITGIVDATSGALAFFGADTERALVNIPFDIVLAAAAAQDPPLENPP